MLSLTHLRCDITGNSEKNISLNSSQRSNSDGKAIFIGIIRVHHHLLSRKMSKMKRFQVDKSPQAKVTLNSHISIFLLFLDHAFTLADCIPNIMNEMDNDIYNTGEEVILSYGNQLLLKKPADCGKNMKPPQILYNLKGMVAKMVLFISSIWVIPGLQHQEREIHVGFKPVNI